jgi:hypothetical protein
MCGKRGLWQRLCYCSAFAIAWLLIASAAEAATLYVLIVADVPDPKLGAYAQANVIEMVTLLAKNVRPEDYNLVAIPDFNEPKKDDLAEDKILTAIGNLPNGPDDAILFYYFGHGELRDNDRPFLLTREGADAISRSKLVEAIKKKKAGLTVILTDASFAVVPKRPGPPIAAAPIVPETEPLFKKLFFRTKGVIDVNGCKKGQIAATCPEPADGSLFSLSVRRVLQQENQSTKSWKEILAEIEQETADQFKNAYPNGLDTGQGHQQTQTVDPIELRTVADGKKQSNVQPGGPATSKIKSRQLGLTVVEDGGRIKVESVDPGQPATRCVDGEGRRWLLQPGDVIAQINGADVTTIEEFATAVRNSPYQMELVVVGNSDQQNHRFKTNVNPRLGVSPGETGGNKVQVVSVVPGSAATRCSDEQGRQWRLEAGDVITSINGQSINSTDQFRKAVAASPPKMTLIVVGTDGQSHELNVTLGD